MYKGRYVALVEYDFKIDESDPNVRPIEQIQEMFRCGMFEKELADLMNEEVFDPNIGDCKVTQTFFDMHVMPEEMDGGAEA